MFGLLVALAAAFAGSFAISMRVALRTRDVVVPDVVGRTVNDASTQLNDLGLTLKEEGRRADAKVPLDRIAGQDPAAGTTTRQPRRVRVWLSAGTHTDAVPGVVGESERTAQMRLELDGLETGEIADVRSASYAPGIVVAQNPPANSPGTHVDLLVNRGEQAASFVMPDLIGVNGERALDFLRGQGFRVTSVAGQPYPGVPSGTVLRQFPRAGFKIGPGEPVSIEVSP